MNESIAKPGLSIKYKLMLLLIILPVVTLILYMILAVHLFKSDKIAYIFDSSTSNCKTLSSQTAAELQSFLSNLKPILEGLNPVSFSFDPTAKALFKKEESFLWLGVYHSKNGSPFEQVTQLKKDTEVLNTIPTDLASSSCHNGISIRENLPPLSGEKGTVFLSVCDRTSKPENRVATLVLVSQPALFQGFKRASLYSNYLVDAQGSQVFGPAQQSPLQFRDWPFFRELQSKDLPTQTQDVAAPDGRHLFASSARIGMGGLYAVSMIDRKAAFHAVEILLWKSLLFFIALVSGSLWVSIFASNRLTSTLRELDQATRRVAKGEFDIQVHVRSKDEVGNLALNFNRMANEVARLMIENITKARMEKELETAKRVQETLFPPSEGILGPLKISGFYEPASECGGDWWHYSEMGDQVFLWIGDVTGHGAPAALITSAAKSAATVIQELPHFTPANALGLLNHAIFESSRGSLMMTFFLGCIDKKSGELTYSNASHNPPVVFRKKADGTFAASDLFLLDENNNPRLGESFQCAFKETKILLKPGDTLCFFTDGMVDLNNSAGKQWGERHFVNSMVQAITKYREPKEIVEYMRRCANEHRNGAKLVDDITFFLCQYAGVSSS